MFAPCEESGNPVVPIDLLKSFLDVSVEFLGGVLARFVEGPYICLCIGSCP